MFGVVGHLQEGRRPVHPYPAPGSAMWGTDGDFVLQKEVKEMVQLSGQLQPTLLACLVPEVVMCLGCHLLMKFGFCLRFFFFLSFFPAFN